jgi:cbb3-type cytochrome c oxidase subunit II
MPLRRLLGSGWRGVSLVTITYVYFLIFAQFAFLHRLAPLGITDDRLRAIMAAMAIGGISLSLLTPRVKIAASPNVRLRIGLGVSSAGAFLTLLPLGLFGFIFVSFLIGSGLGLLTVTLVTYLRYWTGSLNPIIKVGLGTGLGYLVCNFPPLFTAPSQSQATIAGIACLAGICATLRMAPHVKAEDVDSSQPPRWVFAYALASFSALVWLDSAAFFIIQDTTALKSGTWEGPIHLWVIGLLHLAAALASAWFLRRCGLGVILFAAFLALGAACFLLLNRHLILWASIFYPIGVSLYSVALVAYPALLSKATSTEARGRQAGWIYAIAGWIASAMGIGMGLNLGYIPPFFVFAAGVVIVLPWVLRLLLHHRREFALTTAMLLIALGLNHLLNATRSPIPSSQVELGKQVYISEGCINCHSQYVRPGTSDVLLWGPVKSLQQIRLESPPLIGNRRQGPDLAAIGGRRSALWLKAHFNDPRAVSEDSIMPSYAFLFADKRGEDLVAYLESLNGSGAAQHLAEEKQWQPTPSTAAKANADDGERLYRRYCATCHSTDGKTRLKWQAGFRRQPPDLVSGPFFTLPRSASPATRMVRMAQIAKFGLSGTDMPGHEYLSDQDIASIALWWSQQFAQSSQHNIE